MTRRASGEGTLFQRKDGRWQGQVTLPGSGLNRPKRSTVYGLTQRECRAKMAALHEAVVTGAPLPGKRTLAEYGEQFLDVHMVGEIQRGHNTESTRRNYRNIWDRHIAPDLGHLRLDRRELTPTVLQQWLAGKARTRSAHSDTVLSPATQTRIYAVLRAVLNAAYRDDLLNENPLNRVKPPRGGSRKVVPLTQQELVLLLQAVEGTRFLHTLVMLMVTTGARPGEALAASWSDIDLDRGRWYISRSLARLTAPGRAGSATTLGLAQTKTPASTATIALPQVAVAGLRRHRLRQAQDRLAARRWLDADLVFTTPVGSLLEPRNVRRELKAAASAAGLKRNVRLHDLRHAAASALMAEGVSIEVTSKVLRHTRLATTSDIYSHLLEEVRDTAALAMDRRFGGLAAPTGGGET